MDATRLTPKQRRTILYAATRLFTSKSLAPWSGLTLEDRRQLSRRIPLEKGQFLYLSKSGAQHLRTIATTLTDADVFHGKASFQDAWQAARDTLSSFLKQGLMPETFEDFMEPLSSLIRERTDTFTYVVSLYGVKLKGIDRAKLGNLTLVRPHESLLSDEGVSDSHGSLPKLMAQMEKDCWLMGNATGTEGVAREAFFDQARLCAGFLSILAGATFEHGAQAFRIGVAVSPEEARTPANMLMSWEHSGERTLGFTRQWRQGQDYEIDEGLLGRIHETPVFATVLDILQKSARNELEEAIVRAVYWYSDAHKDPNQVMRLVKFWSCVEGFFSRVESPDLKITRAVSVGVAGVLVFGPFRYVPRDEYLSTKTRLAALYGKRSKAVHAGDRDHVLYEDLAYLSQWVAWLILSIAAMTRQFSSPEEILANCLRLDDTFA